MKKLLLISFAVLSSLLARAGLDGGGSSFAARDTLQPLTDEYLDTVKIVKIRTINDYMTIGASYGVTLSSQIFNPSYSQSMLLNPNYFSVMFSRYGKMFGYLPYFGFEIGFEYMHSGFKMKQFEDESGKINYFPVGDVDNVMGVTQETISVMRVPFRAKFHVDAGPVRFMANLGIYGGYRAGISRQGIGGHFDEIRNSFLPNELRFDYGLEGGVGIGILIDPVEFYVNGLVGWAWQSLCEPTSTPSRYNQYYYRYVNPLDIAITFGIHVQLTKRTGKTSFQLKKEAKSIVYGEKNKGEDRK